MRVFFFKKDIIIWGIVLLAVVIALIVLLRIAGSGKEMHQGVATILNAI
ncbi:hypothetical protein KVG29_10800 [Caldicoprobacter algeriensis]|nr:MULTISPECIES: hypothetical protein [Caldicoprobacter]MCM8901708.1 hypothetical protein [Caldicoprobacter algeriensis]